MARELQQGIEPFPASYGDIYRVRAMDVNTPVDNFDAVIASHGSGLLAAVGLTSGNRWTSMEEIEERHGEILRDRDVVLYCS